MTTFSELQHAYLYCQKIAQSHYENFPVASALLPKALRQPISVIYAFARTADNFADEGDASQAQRLKQLAAYDSALRAIAANNYQGGNLIFIALADVIKQHNLPIKLFNDLLNAFKQDVVKQRYHDFDDVLDYCKRSADPVGRLLLLLAGKPTEKQLMQSDAICTALQLINFYQDIVQDINESDRIYIPTSELLQFNIDEKQLTNMQADSTVLAPLLHLQYQRTLELMMQGFKLGTLLKGRIGWEVRAITLGGISMLNQLISQNDNALLTRPRLSRLTLFKIMLISMSKKVYHHHARKLLTKHS